MLVRITSFNRTCLDLDISSESVAYKEESIMITQDGQTMGQRVLGEVNEYNYEVLRSVLSFWDSVQQNQTISPYKK